MAKNSFMRGVQAGLARDTPAFGGTRRLTPNDLLVHLKGHASPELLAALDSVLVDKLGRSSADEILGALDVALDPEEQQP